MSAWQLVNAFSGLQADFVAGTPGFAPKQARRLIRLFWSAGSRLRRTLVDPSRRGEELSPARCSLMAGRSALAESSLLAGRATVLARAAVAARSGGPTCDLELGAVALNGDDRTHAVRKSFQSLEVIHGIDLAVEDGSFTVFVGPSGCGKSTLLRMIAGLEEVTSGEVMIDGARCDHLMPGARAWRWCSSPTRSTRI